jgi:hypothetical protein
LGNDAADIAHGLRSRKLDVYRLAVLRRIVPSEAEEGKQVLERIVSMLWRMIESQQSHPDHGTKISTSTMTIASTSPSTRAALPKRDR